MSDQLAIAAATEALRALLQKAIPELDHELSDLTVTTQPLDLARNGVTNAQLNLFLYQVEENFVGRNQASPTLSPPGGIDRPALALNLRYAVTVFGRGDYIGDQISNRILGGAMSILHDHPVLAGDEIYLAHADTGHKAQIERLQVTFLRTSIDDLSKLWMTFKSPYRLSVVYEVTVDLIGDGAPLDIHIPSTNARPSDQEERPNNLGLPAPEQAMLRKIADQIKERVGVYDDRGLRVRMSGPGICVLFEGEDNAAKRMTAEALASELGLLLYRVDLSGLVSKYIGETEKNLDKLFDAAGRGQVILFFDEANALLGKRADVKDSHDRYANIQINDLLQRIESRDGLMIFSTKPEPDLDPAFLRRLRFHVNFSGPNTPE